MKKHQVTSHSSLYAAVGIVSELGFLIALPVVVFGIGGTYLDTYMGTLPMFMLLGFLLAFAVSAMAVWQMIRQLQALDAAQETSAKRPPSLPAK